MGPDSGNDAKARAGDLERGRQRADGLALDFNGYRRVRFGLDAAGGPAFDVLGLDEGAGTQGRQAEQLLEGV